VAIEDAGFEIRDSIAWMYGSGFPKSLDVSKAIDKAAGTLKVVGQGKAGKTALGQSSGYNHTNNPHEFDITEPNSPEAQQWEGWGTALKPAHEPVVVGRKPFAKDSTVAANVLLHGVGGLNIDASRIGRADGDALGRWPANVILDEYGGGLLDEQSGENPSRFYYCAKASKRDRNEGLDGLEEKGKVYNGQSAEAAGRAEGSVEDKFSTKPSQNFHPTVKPTTLMRYLIKLVTPPGGTVLDPFTGSGSTGKAALLDGFGFVGVELTEEYLPIIEGRLRWALEQEGETDERLF